MNKNRFNNYLNKKILKVLKNILKIVIYIP